MLSEGRYRTRDMEIEPRTFGDSLSDLIHMLGKVWRPLLMPALATSVAVAIISFLLLTTTGALDFFELTFNDPEAISSLTNDQLSELIINLFTAIIWIGIASAVFFGFLYLAAARAVGEELSQEPSGRSIVGAALTGLLGWLIASFLVFIGGFIGFLLLIIPGIWLVISMSMIAQAIAVEGIGPISAMRRSYNLVKGNWWETFGFLLLVGLIGGTASQVVQLVAVPLFIVGTPSFAFGVTIALGVAFQGLIIAAIAVGTAIWYFNLRARTDGPFQLQLN